MVSLKSSSHVLWTSQPAAKDLPVKTFCNYLNFDSIMSSTAQALLRHDVQLVNSSVTVISC